MRTSSNAYRDTKHPGDLNEFLNRALLSKTETEQILANSPLIPPNTLDLPEWEPIMRWSILQRKDRRKATVLTTMKIGDGWLELEVRDEEDGFSGNEIPPSLLSMLDQNQAAV